jgi:gliding motility-associated lipoprotein GldH
MKQCIRQKWLPALFIICLAACNKISVFEKQAAIPSFKWAPSYKPVFDFDITDTAVPYNIFVVCRHNDAYRYSNLWIRVTEQLPGDTARRFDMQLDLTNNNQEWRGAGMDDIFELRTLPRILQARMLRKGKCVYTIEQLMYDNPLENIMNIGLRVEKIKS